MSEAVPLPFRAVDMATLSHQGHKRRSNQDFFLISPRYDFSIVADGVGGQGDGAWASRFGTQFFAQSLDLAAKDPSEREVAVASAVRSAHESMRLENMRKGGDSSGTTIAGIWIPATPEDKIIAFNVGDSPIYHCSKTEMVKISQDHTLYQLWLDGGRAGKEPNRRAIVQAMGISDVVSPFVHSVRVAPGDIVLICTDGLSGTILPSRIKEILDQAGNAQGACEDLIKEVLRGPAPDNVTVSVCYF